MDNDTMVAVTLKDRRERLGLTLRDVEEISNGAISNSYLSQLETGKIKSPSLENARLLASIYCCQTDDIADALALPTVTPPLRCHCCGQSLLHAKFITDTRHQSGRTGAGEALEAGRGMTAPTKVQIERARAIADRLYPGSGNGIAYEAALAAIIETQEWAASVADNLIPSAHSASDAVVQAERDAEIAAAIRDGIYRDGA